MRMLILIALLLLIALYFLSNSKNFEDEMNNVRAEASLDNSASPSQMRLEGRWQVRIMAYYQYKSVFILIPHTYRYFDDKTVNFDINFTSNRCALTTPDVNLLKWNNCSALTQLFPCSINEAKLSEALSLFFTTTYIQDCGNPDFDRQIDKYRMPPEMLVHAIPYASCNIKSFKVNQLAFECELPIEELGYEKVKYLVLAKRMSR